MNSLNRLYRNRIFFTVLLCVTVFLILFTLLSFGQTIRESFAMEKYEPLTVRLPFSYIDTSRMSGTCTVKIENLNGAPAPDAETKVVKDGGNDYFSVEITTPGIYSYKVYQVAGSDKSVSYDDTVYTITIYVTNGAKEGELSYIFSVDSSKTGLKPEKMEFTNIVGGDINTQEETTTEITTETTTEKSTETTTEKTTETSTEKSKETTTEKLTETMTETSTEATTEKPTGQPAKVEKNDEPKGESILTGDMFRMKTMIAINILAVIGIIVIIYIKSKRDEAE